MHAFLARKHFSLLFFAVTAPSDERVFILSSDHDKIFAFGKINKCTACRARGVFVIFRPCFRADIVSKSPCLWRFSDVWHYFCGWISCRDYRVCVFGRSFTRIVGR
jgi:hypothetical protein